MNKSAIEALKELLYDAQQQHGISPTAYTNGFVDGVEQSLSEVGKAHGWYDITTLPESAGMPLTILVATSQKSVYTAWLFEGELTLITPMDGLTTDWKIYGDPIYWRWLPAIDEGLNPMEYVGVDNVNS